MAIFGGENLPKVTVIAAFLFLMWLCFVQHNPVLIWYYLAKILPHVPSNQAINTNKQTKPQNNINNDFIEYMKCCIDVISLILYQLVAVMPSQHRHTHYIEA